MKKVLKNVFKWLVCVCLTFSVVFTLSHFAVICTGVHVQVNSEQYSELLEEENVKWYDEITTEQFLAEDHDELTKLYSKYPAGVTRAMYDIANYISYGKTAIISLVLGIIIGTAVYMLQDIDKKGLKMVIVLYILSIVILGFVQGFLNIRVYNGGTLSLIERWMFPDEYIIPVSIVFALVIIVRFLRQKEIANKLNEKLKEIKEKK